MSALSDVMLWATRINAMKDAPAHQILEIKAEASLEDAQAAFHKIARIAHPDLHRTTLTTEELELVTRAYGRAAGAYQELRTQRMTTTRMKPLQRDSQPIPTQRSSTAIPTQRSSSTAIPVQRASTTPPVGTARATTPPAGAPAVGAPGGATAASSMSSKALIYYRKAELSLRRGDLKGALLQLKMAIAADPQSALLRTALTEVEAEVSKTS